MNNTLREDIVAAYGEDSDEVTLFDWAYRQGTIGGSFVEYYHVYKSYPEITKERFHHAMKHLCQDFNLYRLTPYTIDGQGQESLSISTPFELKTRYDAGETIYHPRDGSPVVTTVFFPYSSTPYFERYLKLVSEQYKADRFVEKAKNVANELSSIADIDIHDSLYERLKEKGRIHVDIPLDAEHSNPYLVRELTTIFYYDEKTP